jgi:hypothetical protein
LRNTVFGVNGLSRKDRTRPVLENIGKELNESDKAMYC